MTAPDWAPPLLLWLSGGAGAGGSFFAVKWFVEWISGREDKRTLRLDQRSDKVDEGMKHLVELLTEQVDALTKRVTKTEEDLAECKRLHAESEARNMRLEAMLQGYGDARQKAAVIVAEAKMEGKQ